MPTPTTSKTKKRKKNRTISISAFGIKASVKVPKKLKKLKIGVAS